MQVAASISECLSLVTYPSRLEAMILLKPLVLMLDKRVLRLKMKCAMVVQCGTFSLIGMFATGQVFVGCSPKLNTRTGTRN